MYYDVECCIFFFFFNDTATTEIYTLSLHDALPISVDLADTCGMPALDYTLLDRLDERRRDVHDHVPVTQVARVGAQARSEEHTSELQSRQYLVCRLLLEKKNTNSYMYVCSIYQLHI